MLAILCNNWCLFCSTFLMPIKLGITFTQCRLWVASPKQDRLFYIRDGDRETEWLCLSLLHINFWAACLFKSPVIYTLTDSFLSHYLPPLSSYLFVQRSLKTPGIFDVSMLLKVLSYPSYLELLAQVCKQRARGATSRRRESARGSAARTPSTSRSPRRPGWRCTCAEGSDFRVELQIWK